MSQQPPYGENPYGPSAYGDPQHGSSPYGTPPDYPTAQYGAPPPQPPKKKTGLIIFLVVGALLIAGGVLATVLILASDDDNKADEGSDDPTSSASESATDDPTDEPTDEPPADGSAIDGQGYTYELPEDWNDVTDEALGGSDAPGTIDTVSVWGKKLEGGRANVIVETGSSGSEEDEEELREEWESNMGSSTGVTPEKIDGTEIDGEDAIGAKMEQTNANGVDIIQIAYLVIVDGTQYSIGLSAKQGDDDAQEQFEDVLASWDWD